MAALALGCENWAELASWRSPPLSKTNYLTDISDQLQFKRNGLSKKYMSLHVLLENVL